MKIEEHVYIKINPFILERGTQFTVSWKIDGETYIQKGAFLSHTLLQESVGANAYTLLQAVSLETSETPLIGCISPGSTLDSVDSV